MVPSFDAAVDIWFSLAKGIVMSQSELYANSYILWWMLCYGDYGQAQEAVDVFFGGRWPYWAKCMGKESC